jgi:hypothetical protein
MAPRRVLLTTLIWAIVKALCEIAGCAYLGMLVVGALNWRGREGNAVYRVFRFIASPMTKLASFLAPARFVAPRHIPVIGFLLTAILYTVALLEITKQCTANPTDSYCVQKRERAK